MNPLVFESEQIELIPFESACFLSHNRLNPFLLNQLVFESEQIEPISASESAGFKSELKEPIPSESACFSIRAANEPIPAS